MVSLLLFLSVIQANPNLSWLNQSIDHQDAQVGQFQQRLYHSKEYVSGESKYLFLEICGEANCSDTPSKLLREGARRKKGYWARLEHRYYGKSHPFAQLTTENLKYLNTQQALNDIEAATEFLKSHWPSIEKVVLVGCSYPGGLAAFARSQNPQLYQAAIAVSAPVTFQTLFPEYDLHRASKLKPECRKVVRQQIRQLEKLIEGQNAAGFQSAMKVIHFKDPVDRVSFREIFGDMLSVWTNKKKSQQFCENVMRNPEDLGPMIEYLARYIEFYNKHEDTISALQVTDVAAIGQYAQNRQWLYQTCTEYGYFQITDSGLGLGPMGKSAEHKRELCRQVFGQSLFPDQQVSLVRYTNPLLRQGSNIIFANTEEDPWHLQSVLPSHASNMESILVEEGRHCLGLDAFDDDNALSEQILDKLNDIL